MVDQTQERERVRLQSIAGPTEARCDGCGLWFPASAIHPAAHGCSSTQGFAAANRSFTEAMATLCRAAERFGYLYGDKLVDEDGRELLRVTLKAQAALTWNIALGKFAAAVKVYQQAIQAAQARGETLVDRSPP